MNTVKTTFRPTILSQSITAILLCGSLLSPAAHAARINIPAGSLDHAIQLLAQQTGIVIAADGQHTRQLKVPAVSGELSASQALQQLLGGSTLEAIRQKDGSYLLRPLTELPKIKVSATAPATADQTVATGMNEARLDTIRVSAAANVAAETATGPVRGYVAKRSATATKTDTPIVETPQSISVIGAEQIQVQGANTLEGALAYTAGVQVREFGSTTDSFKLRGFDANGNNALLIDGNRALHGHWNAALDPYAYERIEVLKGAAGMIAGSIQPGGAINLVRKRPNVAMHNEVNVQYGSHERKQATADLGGVLDEAGAWSWHLTGLLRDAETQVDYIPDDKKMLAAALQWRASNQTKVTLFANWQDQNTAWMAYIPKSLAIDAPADQVLSRSRFVGVLGTDKKQETATRLAYEVVHEFSDSLSLKHTLDYSARDNEFLWSSMSGEVDANGHYVRSLASERNNEGRVLSGDVHLNWQQKAGAWQHQILFGVDAMRGKTSSILENAELTPFNPTQPDYTSQPFNFTPNTWPWSWKEIRVGAYLQDQVKFNQQWIALVGGRYDRINKQEWSSWTPNDITEENDSAFTGRAGLVYLAENGLAPFISWSQSFEPQAGKSRTGQRFKPTRGDQYEVGVRYQPQNQKWLLSASSYRITQANVTTPDPQGNNFSVQTGEVRSQGLELELQGELLPGWNVIGAYTYTDARTSKSEVASEVGQRRNNVPYHQASLWSDYSLGALGLAGVKVGAGARFVGSSVSGIYTLPSYTLFDAMLSYGAGNWRAALNGRNLGDKKFFTDCSWQCYWGQGRTVEMTIGYRW